MATATSADPLAVPARIARIARSSIGAKAVMALTGLVLVGFVFAHMLGNLQLFLGPEVFNNYAATLKGPLHEVLLFLRLVLLVSVVAHIASAARLVLQNRAARPDRYVYADSVQVRFAARTMPVTGLIVLVYIVYHLLHFTLGVTHPEHFALHDAAGRHDVYSMVVLGFQSWPLVAWYVFANLLLCLHLNHGISSLFQSLGLSNRVYGPFIRFIGPVLAIVLFLGFISTPLACALGFITPAGGA